MKPGAVGAQRGEISFAVAEQDVAGRAVEASELGEEAELVSTEDQVGVAVVIDIQTADGIDRGELHGGGQPLDAEAAAAFVEGDDGRGIVEQFYVRAVELFGGEEFLDGPFGFVF